MNPTARPSMEENKSHLAFTFFAQRKNIYTSISGASSSNFKIFRACKYLQEPSLLFVPQCYNHLQKYLQHCTVDLTCPWSCACGHPSPLVKVASASWKNNSEWRGGREWVLYLICLTSSGLWKGRFFDRVSYHFLQLVLAGCNICIVWL